MGLEEGFGGPRGVAEGRGAGKARVKENCKQRLQIGVPRAGFFCGLVLFGPQGVLFCFFF